jgi:hypothetical protein
MNDPITYTNGVLITTAGITGVFNGLHNPNKGAVGVTVAVTPARNQDGDQIVVRILPGQTLPIKVRQAKPTGANIVGIS